MPPSWAPHREFLATPLFLVRTSGPEYFRTRNADVELSNSAEFRPGHDSTQSRDALRGRRSKNGLSVPRPHGGRETPTRRSETRGRARGFPWARSSTRNASHAAPRRPSWEPGNFFPAVPRASARLDNPIDRLLRYHRSAPDIRHKPLQSCRHRSLFALKTLERCTRATVTGITAAGSLANTYETPQQSRQRSPTVPARSPNGSRKPTRPTGRAFPTTPSRFAETS